MQNDDAADIVGILFIGDIIGKPGRTALKNTMSGLVSEYAPDFIIANGENSAHGMGITPDTAKFLFSLGIDVLTTGNHVWDQKSILPYIAVENRLLRPANYSKSAPGNGYGVFETKNKTRVAVINLEGRVFMKGFPDSPFTIADEIIGRVKDEGGAGAVIIDFHAEATSEKEALAFHLDGKISALIGTHTHVQTNDEIIFPGGTAYITDAGMVGSKYSVLGTDKNIAVRKYLTGMPEKFSPEEKNIVLNAVFIKINKETNMAVSIKKIRMDAE